MIKYYSRCCILFSRLHFVMKSTIFVARSSVIFCGRSRIARIWGRISGHSSKTLQILQIGGRCLAMGQEWVCECIYYFVIISVRFAELYILSNVRSFFGKTELYVVRKPCVQVCRYWPHVLRSLLVCRGIRFDLLSIIGLRRKTAERKPKSKYISCALNVRGITQKRFR